MSGRISRIDAACNAIVIAIALVSGIADAAALPRITVASEIRVEESRIHLGDLLTPESHAALASTDSLDETVLALSPEPGKARLFESRDLLRLSLRRLCH